jgi:uncharacterized protein (TIGR00299 family) protein
MAFLIIDPSVSGAAGDMLIAGLLDLVDQEKRNEFCSKFSSILVNHDPKFRADWKKINIHGFYGVQIQVNAEKKFSPDKLRYILTDLSQTVLKREININKAKKALDLIVEAEKAVHGLSNDDKDFHFHELATLDTVFDIIGLYYLLEILEIDHSHTYMLPIAVGGGSRLIAHGLVSIPSPATTEIIKQGKLQIQGGPIQEELLTPTGAAILASLKSTQIQYLPNMKIDQIGRSFGTIKPKEGKQSFLRIIKGSENKDLSSEEITILETNVDDVDGETIGYLFDLLFSEQLVLDFFVTNTIMKKNRPGYHLQAIVKPSKVPLVSNILMKELGTLGVRVLAGYRHTVPRTHSKHELSVKQGKHIVHLKRGYINDELISEKVEYEDLKKIARKEDKPLRKVRKEIDLDIGRRNNTNE